MLCWRRARDGLEVLLVHRPRYDDWSWPKGKARSASRCPRRPCGRPRRRPASPSRLGRPLGQVRYRLEGGRRKQVTYWAAVPTGADAPERRPADRPPARSTAWRGCRWRRRGQCSPGPRTPPRWTCSRGTRRPASSTPCRCSSSGTARPGPRDSWARADADRPLVSAGRRQARALVPLLACWRPERIVSSPWRRCLETVAPFAAAAGLRRRDEGRRSARSGARRSPARDPAAACSGCSTGRGRRCCARTGPCSAEVFDVVRATPRPRRRRGGAPPRTRSSRPARCWSRTSLAHRARPGRRRGAAPAAGVSHSAASPYVHRRICRPVTRAGWACSPRVHDDRTVASLRAPSVGAGRAAAPVRREPCHGARTS